MTVNILSNHRLRAPRGMAGGGPGALGRNRLLRTSGELLELGSVARVMVAPGDAILIDTPGGGGWGSPTEDEVGN